MWNISSPLTNCSNLWYTLSYILSEGKKYANISGKHYREDIFQFGRKIIFHFSFHIGKIAVIRISILKSLVKLDDITLLKP